MTFDWLEPLSSILQPHRRRIYWTALSLGTIVAVVAALRLGRIFALADSASYLELASGHAAMLPFSSRQLAPLLVRLLARATGMPVESCFFVLGTAALLVAFGLILRVVVRSGAPRWMISAVAGMFFWTMLYNGLVLPDVLYTAMLAYLLLLLEREQMMAAALMMFPLMLARESTMLTLVCLLVAGWGRLRRTEMAVAAGAAVAGAVVVKHLAAASAGNAEGVSPLLYLIAKLPWNFAKNFLGLNLFTGDSGICGVTPIWQMPVHIGRLRTIGICGYDASLQGWLIFEALAVFGLLVPMAWRLRRTRLPGTGRQTLMLRFAVVYGTISYALAGALGTAVPRLFGYSWPLFLIAVPIWAGASKANFTSGRWVPLFLLLHLSLTWLNWETARPLPLLALALFAAGCWLLAKTFSVPANVPVTVD